MTGQYRASLWEKIVSTVIACLAFALVAYLVIRNQPISDPQIASMLRIFISLGVSVLGATIPGFLHVDWSAKGFSIRAAGALALFVVTYFYSPKLAPDLDEHQIPPLVNPHTLSSAPLPWESQVVFAAESALALRSALQGDATNDQLKLYDLTISNASREQRILTTFHLRWLYSPGGALSVEEGVILKPQQKYSVAIPLDVEKKYQLQEIEYALSPAILLPPANASGPSVATIRMEVLYNFVGMLKSHATVGWELYYDVAVKDDYGESLTLLRRGWHTNRNIDWVSKYVSAVATTNTSASSVQVTASNRTFCVPGGYQVEISASGNPGYAAIMIGRLDPRVQTMDGLERAGPDHPVVTSILDTNISSFTTPVGESVEGCYKFELGDFRVHKLPINDIRGNNWRHGDFAQVSPGTGHPFVEVSGLDENFHVKITWHVAK